MISTSEIKISVVVAERYMELALGRCMLNSICMIRRRQRLALNRKRVRGVAMNWQKDDLVQHFVGALDNAQIEHAPFSHLFAVDLFPGDVYNYLVKLLPQVQGYKSLNHRDAMRSDGTSTREVLPFNETFLEPLPAEQRDFFELLKSVLDDRRIGEKYFELLAPDLAKRTAAKIPTDVEAYPKSGLFRDAWVIKSNPININTKM